ncbi:hypothetical protein D9M68_674560 [compost metagenome]
MGQLLIIHGYLRFAHHGFSWGSRYSTLLWQVCHEGSKLLISIIAIGNVQVFHQVPDRILRGEGRHKRHDAVVFGAIHHTGLRQRRKDGFNVLGDRMT